MQKNIKLDKKIPVTTRVTGYILNIKVSNSGEIPALLAKYKGALSFKADAVPYFSYRKLQKSKKEKEEQILENIRQVVEDIRALAE